MKKLGILLMMLFAFATGYSSPPSLDSPGDENQIVATIEIFDISSVEIEASLYLNQSDNYLVLTGDRKMEVILLEQDTRAANSFKVTYDLDDDVDTYLEKLEDLNIGRSYYILAYMHYYDDSIAISTYIEPYNLDFDASTWTRQIGKL